MAEKINASPQNSAFESGTRQSMQHDFPNQIPKYGTFLLETNVPGCFIILDHAMKIFLGQIYLSGLKTNNRKGAFFSKHLKAGTDKHVSKFIEEEVIYSSKFSNVF